MNETQRATFAQHVVSVHCGVTGAPPSFVHALITDSSGSLPDGMNAAITGTIRAGRTDEQKAEIHRRMSVALAEAAAVDPATVTCSTNDVEASYTMEGGVLLPEPGSAAEQAWLSSGSG